MDMPNNSFKKALANEIPAYGLWLSIPDTSVAEIAAGAGFDWLLIDHEHGNFEIRDICHHLQAMAAYPVAPIVRPVNDDPALLKRLLDSGVQTLLMPMIESAEQAEAVVHATRYPPEGSRGLGTSMARAAHWNGIPGYIENSNEQICVIIQVETANAVEKIDDILKVDGVDGIFLGPSDLSASMGYPGNAGHPEVKKTLVESLSKIRAASKIAGLLCLDPELRDYYIDHGAQFIGVGVDTLLLAQSARQLASKCRSQGKDKNETNPASY